MNKPGCTLLILFVVLVNANMLSAQVDEDSLVIAQRIATAYPGRTTTESARAVLVDYLKAGTYRQASELIGYMNRQGGAVWLSPTEQLMAGLLVMDSTMLEDRQRLTTLLAGSIDPDRRSTYRDQLVERMRPLLRSGVTRIVAWFDGLKPQPEERRFLEILLNHLLVVGYRARTELNDRVDHYIVDFPQSWRSVLAGEYIRQAYDESDFGAAFSAGYGTGLFTGTLGEHFDSQYGPVLGGELYIYRITIAGMLGFGVATSPSVFPAAERTWQEGDAPVVTASLGAGYEFRMERLGITPIVGLAVQELRSPGEETVEGGELPRTGYRSGLDLGMIVGWRIPFDVGTSVDLRVRLDRVTTLLAEYDPAFTGASYSIQFGFALVQRPYRSSVR